MSATPENTLADPEQRVADLELQLVQCRAEREEALGRETATAEVLEVINSSPGDLAPVFDAMLDKAMRLCQAAFGIMFVVDEDRIRIVAEREVPKPLSGYLVEHPPEIGLDTLLGRSIRERKILHTPDALAGESYRAGVPLAVKTVELGGVRALLHAPLLKDRDVLGVFAIFRQESRAFSDKQITLLQNFAAQAVIAMENARLLTETQEALEQQTATAEVLQVINSSPGDLAPVFDAMLIKAMELCGASFGVLRTYDGEVLDAVAVHGEPRIAERIRQLGPIRPETGSLFEPLVQGEDVLHIADLLGSDAYRADPIDRERIDAGGIRTWLAVALRKQDTLLGAIIVYRKEVRHFTDKQIALLQNFAAQAVIAMENARLITATREALEQQTATAEVLGVINSSPGDLAPVFNTLVETAARLCVTNMAGLAIRSGDVYRYVATRSLDPAWDAYLSGLSFTPGR